MKNNFTITRIIMPKIIIIILLFLIVLGTSNIIQGDILFEEQEYKKLINIADSKALRVTDFLEQKKSDAIFLSEAEEVKEIFEMELIISEELMKEKIKKISEKTRDEVEEYLLKYPKMTIVDLKNDSKFQSIATQRVGGSGYVYVYDYDAMINLFHKNKNSIGRNYTELKDERSEDWWKITGPTQYGKEELGGFVLFEESDGSFKRKYKYTTISKIKTFDGIGLAIAATTYIDEYVGSVEPILEIHDELMSFQENKGYDDLIFISPEGNVIWTAKRHNELGTNLITGPYNDSLLANVFNKAKKDLGVGISDSKEYDESGGLNIFITSPIFKINRTNSKRTLLGIVALKIDNEKIQELITEEIGLEGSGEIYIVNRDYNHITPLKYDLHDKAHSEHGETIHSKRIDECFVDYNNYYANQGGEINGVSKSGIYLNYANPPNKVMGAHSYVLDSGWCIIAENSYKEFKEKIPNENLFLIAVLILIFIFSLISTFILDYFFRIKGDKRIK